MIDNEVGRHGHGFVVLKRFDRFPSRDDTNKREVERKARGSFLDHGDGACDSFFSDTDETLFTQGLDVPMYRGWGRETHAVRNFAIRRGVPLVVHEGLDEGEHFRLFFGEGAHRSDVKCFLFGLRSLYNTNKNRTQTQDVDNRCSFRFSP